MSNPTARDLCSDALDEAGVLGVGQTALAEDITKVFTRLQRMVAVWQKERWLVPSLQHHSFTADGSISYSIGLGGDINIPRPSDIKGAYVVQRNTGQNPVSLPLRKIFSYEDYINIAVKNLPSLPTRFFYDGANPLGNFFPIPIPNSQYDLHFIAVSPLGFGSTITAGAITAAGAGYGADAIYNSIALTGGSGTGATADITVTGGVVAVVNLLTGGQDYAIDDELSASSGDIGGGAGFVWKVSDIGPNLDTVITLPPEYQEALMYNLTIRACSLYQVQPMPETSRLAKMGLNVIRRNNTQVPSLSMPVAPGLNRGRSFSLYNPDGY